MVDRLYAQGNSIARFVDYFSHDDESCHLKIASELFLLME